MKNWILVLLLTCAYVYSQNAFSLRDPTFLYAAKRKVQAAPPSNGLLNNIVSYWPFTSSGGAAYGGVPMNSAGGSANYITNGLIGSGASFPFWGDYSFGFYTPSSISLDISQDFTASIWVAPFDASGANGQYGTIIRISNGFSESVAIALDVGNGEADYAQWTAGTGTSSGSIGINNGSGWAANQWFHLVLVFDSANLTLSIYNNGSYADTISVTSLTGSSSCPELDLLSDYGELPYSFGSAACRVDETGVWQRQLTPVQIMQLYNGGAGYPFSSFTH